MAQRCGHSSATRVITKCCVPTIFPTISRWDKPGAGVGETEINCLFYRLGWTKGWYKGNLRDKVFGQIASETTKPDWKMIKTKLTEMARKYDRAA